jgi:hypothetical protein
MGAKYKPTNEQHRKWLAENLIRICVGFGYVIDFDHCAVEMVFKKSINENIIRVYTSVDKRTHQMRMVGQDAVRVAVVDSNPSGLFRRKINRAGEFKKIGDRLAKALKDAERRAARPY